MEVRLFGLVAIGAALLVPSVALADDPTPPTETPVVTPEPTPPSETPPAETPPAETPPTETPPAETPPAETPPATPPAPAHPPGISLGADIRLHARFDVSYERHSYSDNPSDGKDALKSNHTFVFLTRHSKSDPFFFNAEVIAMKFFEAGYRLRPSDLEEPWRFAASAGKILIPFGSEPLYHHAYGGRVGGDQRFVPAVWADYGLKGTFNLDFEPVHLRFDAYAVNGLVLGKRDAILGLGNASQPTDMNLAGGGRISASFGPLNLYYSIYGCAVNFGKTVVMQGLDISLFRLSGVPFLEDLAVSAGVVRADVWGGGDPAYYHFADYIEVRYYPIDTLFIQYRGGLDMRDNRSGVFADAARLDKNDTSGHSVGIGWQIHGLTLLAQHHWQLELADEQADDFFRITATYEF